MCLVKDEEKLLRNQRTEANHGFRHTGTKRYKPAAGGKQEGRRREGGGKEEERRRDGGGMEEGWRRDGGGMEEG